MQSTRRDNNWKQLMIFSWIIIVWWWLMNIEFIEYIQAPLRYIELSIILISCEFQQLIRCRLWASTMPTTKCCVSAEPVVGLLNLAHNITITNYSDFMANEINNWVKKKNKLAMEKKYYYYWLLLCKLLPILLSWLIQFLIYLFIKIYGWT